MSGFSWDSSNSNSNNSGFGFGSNSSSNNNNNNSNNNSMWGSGSGSSSSFWGNSNSNNNNNNNNNNNSNSNTWGFSNMGQNFGQNNNNGFNFNSNNNNNNNNNNNTTNNNNNNNRNNDNPIAHAKCIHDAYSINHNNCRFECILYNKVPKGYNNHFVKPQNTRIEIWENGIKNNPDPSNLVPASVRGYKQLKERADLCVLSHVTLMSGFRKLTGKVSEISQNLDVKTRQEILDLKQTQSDLSYRLLIILREYICRMYPQREQASNHNVTQQMSQIFGRSSLSPINIQNENNSYLTTIENPLTDTELRLKRIFETILQEIRAINHHFAQIDESLENIEFNSNNNNINTNNNDTSIVGSNNAILNASLMNQSIMASETNNGNILMGENMNNQVLSQDAMKGMFDFLKKQQTLLANLKRTVQDDWDDLEIITQGMMKHAN